MSLADPITPRLAAQASAAARQPPHATPSAHAPQQHLVARAAVIRATNVVLLIGAMCSAAAAARASSPSRQEREHAHQAAPAAVASFREGVEAQRREAWEVAARAYARAIAIDQEFAEAHANLGTVRSRLGQYDEAVAAYERALAIAPDLPAVRINLGLAHFRAGAAARAVGAFRDAVAHDPRSAQARSLLGLALVEAGKNAEAIPYLEASVEATPDDAGLVFALGRAYAASASRDGRGGDSGSDSSRGDSDGGGASGGSRSSKGGGSGGGAAKADAVAARLAALPAGRPLWHHLQGLQLQHQGRHREALAAFEAARADQPALPGVALAVGISLLALGEDIGARDAFAQAHAQAPRDAVPVFYLAWIDERAGRLASARPQAEQALALDPDFDEARALLGKVLLGQGDAAQAARHLATAAVHDPDDASIRYLLAQAYQRAGDAAAAAREFATASRLKARQVAGERQP
jgi:tetratricopeptide (TPR) repeat protein